MRCEETDIHDELFAKRKQVGVKVKNIEFNIIKMDFALEISLHCAALITESHFPSAQYFKKIIIIKGLFVN